MFPFLHTAEMNTDVLQSSLGMNSRSSGGIPGTYQTVEKMVSAFGVRGLRLGSESATSWPCDLRCFGFSCDVKQLSIMVLKIGPCMHLRQHTQDEHTQ